MLSPTFLLMYLVLFGIHASVDENKTILSFWIMFSNICLFSLNLHHTRHHFYQQKEYLMWRQDYFSGWLEILAATLNFLIFTIFDHFCKILYPRKVSKPQNHKIKNLSNLRFSYSLITYDQGMTLIPVYHISLLTVTKLEFLWHFDNNYID